MVLKKTEKNVFNANTLVYILTVYFTFLSGAVVFSVQSIHGGQHIISYSHYKALGLL